MQESQLDSSRHCQKLVWMYGMWVSQPVVGGYLSILDVDIYCVSYIIINIMQYTQLQIKRPS